MKKSTLIFTLLSILTLIGCNGNNDLQIAQDYCNNGGGSLSQEGNLFICTYPDGSTCVAEDFSKSGCIDLEGTNLHSEELDSARKNLGTEEHRIDACQDKVLFLLNSANAEFSWGEESEGGASFYRNGKVTYTKRDGTASEDVECMIDMVDASINVEFSNHIFEGVVFYPEDDEDGLRMKRESYVNNSIALENDNCISKISNTNDIPYGTYKCQQITNEGGQTNYYNRAGIYNIFDDERILTCNEANGEQGAGFNQEKFGTYNNDKSCEELLEYIEDQLKN